MFSSMQVIFVGAKVGADAFDSDPESSTGVGLPVGSSAPQLLQDFSQLSNI
jgi:hypothetical protein